MEATEITKVIDGVYKNILENFNPASRQMINTGKAYLKSLHGASAASSLYLDTLMRLSRQAQQSTLGNSGDIGSSLMQITEVFKEIHAQQLNTLKAFYVDFLIPLETNLEKDTRVIQTEQKKFLMCHKQRMESYNKAASTVKKMRKKSKKSNASAATLDKEIKVMQTLEEERSKLEAFCDKSIKEALTQERRRYGFILERQASLAKHYLAFYSKGNSLLNTKLENWMKVAKTREILPESMQNSLLKRIQGGDEEDCIYCSPRKPGVGNSADDTASISSQLRKTKSMDAGEIINLQSEQGELTLASGAGTMSRAKSELNLMMNGGGSGSCGGMGFCHEASDGAGNPGVAIRPKSLAVATETSNTGYAKALYAYLSSGENQLSFLEGDIIGLIGDKNKGWQYGENLRTQKTGWFPVAYTEMDVSTPALEMSMKSATMPASSSSNQSGAASGASPVPPPMPVAVPLPPSVVNMNNMNNQQNMTQSRMMIGHGHGHVHRTPESMMSQPTTPSAINHKSVTSPTSPMGPGGNVNTNNNLIVPATQSRGQQTSGRHGHVPAAACASDSLHSSNDSGFSNDITNTATRGVIPPPQPDIDYSDDEPQHSNRRKAIVVQGDKTPPQTGDKWLMERYHMSESIRIGGLGIGGITRRRSLSFSNVSGVGVNSPVRSSTRGPHDYGQNGYPRYDGRYANVNRGNDPHAQAFRNRPGQQQFVFDKDSGPLKKFLNRTKSLIWKRQALDRFDSISAAGSTASLELWGSHTSLIEASYDAFEMKELSSKDHHYDDNDTIKNENIGNEEELPGKGASSPIMMPNKNSFGKNVANNNGTKAVPPPLPPFPANLRGLNGINVKPAATLSNANDKATSTTDSLKNLSLSHSPLPLDGDNIDGTSTIGGRDNDSCIFISDHMKTKGSTRSGSKSIKSSIVTERHSKKIQADLIDDDDDEMHVSVSMSRKKGRQSQVTRVESFSDSEAPIVPVQNGKNQKKKAMSSVQAAQQQARSSNATVVNGKKKQGYNNQLEEENDDESTVRGPTAISRSYIMEKSQSKYSYTNSDEEDVEVDVDEYGVDEDVIDFDDDENDTSVYNDNEVDNTSSVFMVEPEPEEEEPVAELKGPRSLPTMHHQANGSTTRSHSTKNLGKSPSISGHSEHINGFGNKTNSLKSSSTNGYNNSSNGHYDHSSRFAPIVAYNGEAVNGGVSGKGRMNSPAPPPPPPMATSNGKSHRSEAQQQHRHQVNGSSHRSSSKQEKSRSKTSSNAAAKSPGKKGREKPIFDYGSQMHRRLYCPERNSRLDQKSERSDPEQYICVFLKRDYAPDRNFVENQYPTLRLRRRHREREDDHDRFLNTKAVTVSQQLASVWDHNALFDGERERDTLYNK
ncbi:unnamed protein product [Allacma fusca]|uniref:Brain-specific angiogenesis inhibitor 1-associated protein 2 n=1 Tax=Allacma fusca TaxID=39272 RepID=A0A8J2IWW0_9HEXA|nr:unnamed protein product [Allacma fusca]